MSRESKNKEVYCSTYCNHGHRLFDGKPIGHECLVIPPKALEAEKEGNFCLAIELIEQSKNKIVKGIRDRYVCSDCEVSKEGQVRRR